MAPDRDDRRHPFIPDGICDLEPIDKELAQANRLIGGFDAYLVIDETSLPKQGQHSVGVAPHRRPCSAREPTAAKPDKRSAPDGASWGPLSPAARAEPEIALEEIDRLTAAGVRFGAVLGRRSWAPFLPAPATPCQPLSVSG